MKKIEIYIPDDFTEEQTDFITASAINQIEAEIRKKLEYPREAVTALNNEINAVKSANGIEKEQNL